MAEQKIKYVSAETLDYIIEKLSEVIGVGDDSAVLPIDLSSDKQVSSILSLSHGGTGVSSIEELRTLIGIFKGATATSFGTIGLVPAPTADNVIGVFKGATKEEDGTMGLVPPPNMISE